MYLDTKSHTVLSSSSSKTGVPSTHRRQCLLYVWDSSVPKLYSGGKSITLPRGCAGDKFKSLYKASRRVKHVHWCHRTASQFVTLCGPVELIKINFLTLLSFYCLNHLRPSHFCNRKCTKECWSSQIIMTKRSLVVFSQ